MTKIKNIRNFSIIAHVDHGKSTFANCLIKKCKNIKYIKNRILDSMDLEIEKGVTIKSSNVSLDYTSLKGEKYQLNIIDTPGHADFYYEVHKSLSICDGAILLVDITKGIESQTIFNYKLALKMGVKIILVINKIDLMKNNSNIFLENILKVIKVSKDDIIFCSSKTCLGIDEVLEKIVKNIPSPSLKHKNKLKALIIDSYFDNYLGIIFSVYLKSGKLYKGKKIKLSNNEIYTINKIGKFLPNMKECNNLTYGEIGWITAFVKNIKKVSNWTYIVSSNNKLFLKNKKKIKHNVYSTFFPKISSNYEKMKNSIEKLQLNDTSFSYKKINSSFFGNGFNCGFLGLFHMEIIQERLKREYKLDLITTLPSIKYRVLTKKNKLIEIDSLDKMLKISLIKKIYEPISYCKIETPKKYIGNIISLCSEKRGIQKEIIYKNFDEIILIYYIPTQEILLNFFNEIKSISNGYATLNYKFKFFKESKIVFMNVLINKKKIDFFSMMIHKNNAYNIGKYIIKKLKNSLKKKLFLINIQILCNNRIIISDKIKPLRKNVISKCYGGDVSRKKKLLMKQKIGKKKLKKSGDIKIDKNIFINFFNNKY
ncbi:MAG: translation elongation factor 4 [Enterobacteriaceae bacterium]